MHVIILGPVSECRFKFANPSLMIKNIRHGKQQKTYTLLQSIKTIGRKVLTFRVYFKFCSELLYLILGFKFKFKELKYLCHKNMKTFIIRNINSNCVSISNSSIIIIELLFSGKASFLDFSRSNLYFRNFSSRNPGRILFIKSF